MTSDTQRPTRAECEAWSIRADDAGRLARYCLALLDDNANLQRDKERLDWVLQYWSEITWWVSPEGDYHLILNGTLRFVGKTRREAIDAAKSEKA